MFSPVPIVQSKSVPKENWNKLLYQEMEFCPHTPLKKDRSEIPIKKSSGLQSQGIHGQSFYPMVLACHLQLELGILRFLESLYLKLPIFIPRMKIKHLFILVFHRSPTMLTDGFDISWKVAWIRIDGLVGIVVSILVFFHFLVSSIALFGRHGRHFRI